MKALPPALAIMSYPWTLLAYSRMVINTDQAFELVLQLPNKYASLYIATHGENPTTFMWIDDLYRNTNHKLSELSSYRNVKTRRISNLTVVGFIVYPRPTPQAVPFPRTRLRTRKV